MTVPPKASSRDELSSKPAMKKVSSLMDLLPFGRKPTADSSAVVTHGKVNEAPIALLPQELVKHAGIMHAHMQCTSLLNFNVRRLKGTVAFKYQQGHQFQCQHNTLYFISGTGDSQVLVKSNGMIVAELADHKLFPLGAPYALPIMGCTYEVANKSGTVVVSITRKALDENLGTKAQQLLLQALHQPYVTLYTRLSDAQQAAEVMRLKSNKLTNLPSARDQLAKGLKLVQIEAGEQLSMKPDVNSYLQTGTLRVQNKKGRLVGYVYAKSCPQELNGYKQLDLTFVAETKCSLVTVTIDEQAAAMELLGKQANTFAEYLIVQHAVSSIRKAYVPQSTILLEERPSDVMMREFAAKFGDQFSKFVQEFATLLEVEAGGVVSLLDSHVYIVIQGTLLTNCIYTKGTCYGYGAKFAGPAKAGLSGLLCTVLTEPFGRLLLSDHSEFRDYALTQLLDLVVEQTLPQDTDETLEISDLLQQWAIMRALEPEDVETLAGKCRLLRMDKNFILAIEGTVNTSTYYIVSGKVLMFTMGDQVHYRVIKKGDVFGGDSRSTWSFTYSALTTCQIVEIPHQAVADLRNGDVSQRLKLLANTESKDMLQVKSTMASVALPATTESAKVAEYNTQTKADVLSGLLPYMDVMQRFACRSVCRQWNEMVTDGNAGQTEYVFVQQSLETVKFGKLVRYAGKSLHRVSFKRCHIYASQLRMLIRYCPNIQYLDMKLCRFHPQVHDDDMTSLVLQGLTKLKEVYLSRFFSLRSRGQLPQPASKLLQALSYCGPGRLGKDEINSLTGQLPALHELTISSKFVVDESVRMICNNCKFLTHLDLSSFNQLTDNSCRTISHFLPALTHLSLASCTQLTDCGLYELSANNQNYQLLNFSNNSNLTTMGFMFLRGNVSQLHTLHVRYCLQITLDLVDMLKDAAPVLQELSCTGTKIPPIYARALLPKALLNTHAVPSKTSDQQPAKQIDMVQRYYVSNQLRVHLAHAKAKRDEQVKKEPGLWALAK